jgi:hypothetical protein
MASVLASIAVDRGFEPWSGQTKDYEIGIGCFSAKHIALRRKSKDLLSRNQDNVSKYYISNFHIKQNIQHLMNYTMLKL